MRSKQIFVRSFRLLLLPFALVYGGIISVRNWLFNIKIFKSASFNFPLICVGNLAVGGTGKSPMVEYLVNLLKNEYNIATLSRGYKRKTKGYALANEKTTALEIGDEPMQFHLKFPDVAVAVGEERLVAIPQLLHDRPATNAIILDDAFQHRAITAGLNILLTECSNPFYNDWFFPSGDLRDQRRSYRRTQIIVVTKCRGNLTIEEKARMIKHLHLQPGQHVFFTCIAYGKLYHITTGQPGPVMHEQDALLVCGIANPAPLKQYIAEHAATYEELVYNDHHIFTIDDLKEIRRKFDSIEGSNKLMITTEKDAVRLLKFRDELHNLPVFVIPVKHHFLFEEGDLFDKRVKEFVAGFKAI